jgi:hypothetical protein
MRHSATINNIDVKLLFEQKCDLVDVIKFLGESSENYPDLNMETWIASLVGLLNMLNDILDGLLNMLDDISDQIEDYYSDQGEN